ncbi:MAG: hypothetical protein WCS84_17945 [Nocardioides sp.]|jgi:hypothetical protein
MENAKGLVYDASVSDPADWAALEAELDTVFRLTQQAVLAGEPIVYVIHEPAIWGHATPLRSALATALMGGMRSAAVEGARAGLAANVVATDVDVDPARLADAIEFLLTSGLTGQVLTCGTTHLGRPAA